MALGRKTGGRKKGTPNRITRETAAQLAEIDCNPFIGMARLAMDPTTPVGIRAHLYAELTEYIHSKRHRIQISGPTGADGQDTPVDLRIVYVNKPYGNRAAEPASAADSSNRTSETV